MFFLWLRKKLTIESSIRDHWDFFIFYYFIILLFFFVAETLLQ